MSRSTQGGCCFLFCPSTRSIDPAVMVAQWYNLQLETRETGVRTLPCAANLRSRLATQMDKRMQLPSESIQVLHFCPRSFDRAVMQAPSQPYLEPEAWSQWRPDLFQVRAQPEGLASLSIMIHILSPKFSKIFPVFLIKIFPVLTSTSGDRKCNMI